MQSLTFHMNIKVLEDFFPNGLSMSDGSIAVDQEIAMFESGAKLYFHGGNRWTISGYAADGSDTQRAIVELLIFQNRNF